MHQLVGDRHLQKRRVETDDAVGHLQRIVQVVVTIAKVVQTAIFKIAAVHTVLALLIDRVRDVDPSQATKIRDALANALTTFDAAFA